LITTSSLSLPSAIMTLISNNNRIIPTTTIIMITNVD
jgi:hypothetical protein